MLTTFDVILLILVFSLCASLIAFQAVTGVPALSSGSAESSDVVSLLEAAEIGPNAIIYELGAGWGSLVVALARAFPDAEIRGIKLSPLPYLIARLKTVHLSNVHIYWGNFYNFDIRDATAVTCYLMIKPMTKLAEFLDRQLDPGTRVVALTFWFRNRKAVAVREGPGLRGAAALYNWPGRT